MKPLVSQHRPMLSLLALLSCLIPGHGASAVHQATGIKICEVTTNSCIVWTRLTQAAERVASPGPRPVITYEGRKRGERAENRPDQKPVVTFPEGVGVDQLEGAVPGADGETRVRYRLAGNRLKAELQTLKAADGETRVRYRLAGNRLKAELQTLKAPDGETRVHYPIAGNRLKAELQTLKAADGETRGHYPIAGNRLKAELQTLKAADQAEWISTSWQKVDPKRDFTAHHRLSSLQPGARYELRVEGRASAGAGEVSTVDGRFRTAPEPGDARLVRFTVVTGQNYWDRDLPDEGWKAYNQMLALEPDFFVHTGDILYYDAWAKTLPLARWMWQQVYGMPTNMRFHRQVASYFIKDDHDTWLNDCWPTMKTSFMGEFTFVQGQAVFLEQVGMGESLFRTVRWGKDLQIWLVEGRDFRSPNNAPDGPQKTIWGAGQKAWFKRTVRDSDATFRVLISPTPLVGPDRSNKNDNHANRGFTVEGDELRAFCASQKGLVVVCGDRHWQYASIDAETRLREYCSGPMTDEHAGGWPKDRKEPEHTYVNVVGGFLEAEVNRRDGQPTLTFRHYSVEGKVLNEDVLRGR